MMNGVKVEDENDQQGDDPCECKHDDYIASGDGRN